MKWFTYRKLDAFSTGKSTGNPAACLYLDGGQDLTELQMLGIAKEHKGFVSEVIYCWLLNNHSYRLRYYSSECEVEFCGHGTIACLYDLMKNNDALSGLKEMDIETNRGILKVYNELQTFDAVFITAPEPEYIPVDIPLNDIAANLNTDAGAIAGKYPVMLIDAGLRTLIVPVDGLNNTIGMQPDEGVLKSFCLNHDIDIVLVFTKDVINKNNQVRTRVFAPRFGYLEDPATGSGNSAMGYYMLKNGFWDGNPISIEQNKETDRYNIVKLKTENGKVLFGGNATTKIKGEYILY